MLWRHELTLPTRRQRRARRRARSCLSTASPSLLLSFLPSFLPSFLRGRRRCGGGVACNGSNNLGIVRLASVRTPRWVYRKEGREAKEEGREGGRLYGSATYRAPLHCRVRVPKSRLTAQSGNFQDMYHATWVLDP